MKCQILFYRKNKYILKCRLLKFLPSMQSVNMPITIKQHSSRYNHFFSNQYVIFSYFSTKIYVVVLIRNPSSGAPNEYPPQMFLWKNKEK